MIFENESLRHYDRGSFFLPLLLLFFFFLQKFKMESTTFLFLSNDLYTTFSSFCIRELINISKHFIYEYILKAVTEELSYTYLKSKLKIPCGRDMYYDRYRRFFWILSNSRKLQSFL